jgi:hypothetical protein
MSDMGGRGRVKVGIQHAYHDRLRFKPVQLPFEYLKKAAGWSLSFRDVFGEIGENAKRPLQQGHT